MIEIGGIYIYTHTYIQEILVCTAYKGHIKFKGTERLKVKKLRMLYPANTDLKKAGVTTLISDKAAFRIWKVIRDNGGHYTMLKGSNI